MKQSIQLLVLVLTISTATKSQITKKNWMVGGNGLFSTQSQNLPGGNVKGVDVNLSPNVGYFIADKLAGGARLGFKYNRTDYNNIVNKNTRFTFGPFLRYYFLNPEKQVNLFTEGSYQYSKVDASGASGSDNTFRLSAGPVIFFNSSVGLEFTLNYEYYSISGAENNYKKFFLGIGFQIHLDGNKN